MKKLLLILSMCLLFTGCTIIVKRYTEPQVRYVRYHDYNLGYFYYMPYSLFGGFCFYMHPSYFGYYGGYFNRYGVRTGTATITRTQLRDKTGVAKTVVKRVVTKPTTTTKGTVQKKSTKKRNR